MTGSKRYSAVLPRVCNLKEPERPGTVWTQFAATKMAEDRRRRAARRMLVSAAAQVRFGGGWAAASGCALRPRKRTWRSERAVLVALRRPVSLSCQSMRTAVPMVVMLTAAFSRKIRDVVQLRSVETTSQVSLMNMARPRPVNAEQEVIFKKRQTIIMQLLMNIQFKYISSYLKML
jgi:hypothetical protein